MQSDSVRSIENSADSAIDRRLQRPTARRAHMRSTQRRACAQQQPDGRRYGARAAATSTPFKSINRSTCIRSTEQHKLGSLFTVGHTLLPFGVATQEQQQQQRQRLLPALWCAQSRVVQPMLQASQQSRSHSHCRHCRRRRQTRPRRSAKEQTSDRRLLVSCCLSACKHSKRQVN